MDHLLPPSGTQADVVLKPAKGSLNFSLRKSICEKIPHNEVRDNAVALSKLSGE